MAESPSRNLDEERENYFKKNRRLKNSVKVRKRKTKYDDLLVSSPSTLDHVQRKISQKPNKSSGLNLKVISSSINLTNPMSINENQQANLKTRKKLETFTDFINNQKTRRLSLLEKPLLKKYTSNINLYFLQDILYKCFSKHKKINYDIIRKYIVNVQNKFHLDFKNDESINITDAETENDEYYIKKLEDLIAVYSIVIYLFLTKNNYDDSKTLFLLMLTENMIYFDIFEKKIFKQYIKLEKTIEIINKYPKKSIFLFKIYGFILKYSTLFNLSNYKNIFLVKYLSLLSLNYKIFKKKIGMFGFTYETKNMIKYWFGSGLHYIIYYTLRNYCPLLILIKISDLIIKLYRNADELFLTNVEKNIIINTSYNNSMFLYYNNQLDQCLKLIKQTKQKIISFSACCSTPYENNIFKNPNLIVNPINYKKASVSGNLLADTSNLNSPNRLKKFESKSTPKEIIIKKKIKNCTFNSPSDFMEKLINRNDKINFNIKDIKEIFYVNLSEISPGSKKNSVFCGRRKKLSKLSYNEIDINNISNIVRASQIEFKGFLVVKETDIPKYLRNPLFLELELFMCKIEITKRNYITAYEHLKNSIIIILIFEKIGNMKSDRFVDILTVISEFLADIEKYCNDLETLKEIKAMKTLKLGRNIKEQTKNKNKNYEVFVNKKNSKINNIENEKYLEDVEKFFIFLNTLSVYQIKLLNDTQPNLDSKRNDLPILFNNQFKTALNTSQIIALNEINTLALSRYMILIDPNKNILPSNLRINLS